MYNCCVCYQPIFEQFDEKVLALPVKIRYTIGKEL